jgi:hypothetical protein
MQAGGCQYIYIDSKINYCFTLNLLHVCNSLRHFGRLFSIRPRIFFAYIVLAHSPLFGFLLEYLLGVSAGAMDRHGFIPLV